MVGNLKFESGLTSIMFLRSEKPLVLPRWIDWRLIAHYLINLLHDVGSQLS